MTRSEFTQRYYPAIVRLTAGTGLFPMVMLSQAIIESSGLVNGQWMPGESLLAKSANNYFGIKASTGWKGKTITLTTGEYVNGQKVYVNGTFRKYDTVEDSLADYVKFLKSNPRYTKAGVFSAANEREQAERLKSAGYATDPNYPGLISSVINSIKQFLPNIPGTDTNVASLIPLGILFFLTYKLLQK